MLRLNGSWYEFLWRHGLVFSLMAGMSVGLLAGCSKSKTPASTAQTESDEEPEKEAKPSEGSSKPSATNKTLAAAPAKRAMIGDIPLDVWLDDPINESKKTGTVAAPAAAPTKPAETVASATKTTPMDDAAPKQAAKPAAGGDDWASVISGDDLQSEIKKIKLEMTDHLSAIGKYNAHYKDDIMANGSVLAGMAAIALVHPEKVSWKDHAAQIRDVSAEMVKKAKGLGQKPFDETKKEFEKIEGLLSGNPPPGVAEAAADAPFSESVSRRGIMKKLQTASDALRANYQTEATFTKGNEEAAHTASVVAALSKIIMGEGYPGADEDEYKNFAKGLMDANLAMSKAAREKDFAAFTEANAKVNKFCGECHAAYQGSN